MSPVIFSRVSILLLMAVFARASAASDRAAFAEGVKLLRAGKAVEALVQLRRAEASYGAKAPAALLGDLALAAQAAGEFDAAASYAERAAAADKAFEIVRDTVIGAARLAEARELAARGSKEASALKGALNAVTRSVRAFARALRANPSSERARRNLERALRLKKQLDQRQEQEKKDDQKKDDKKKNEKDDKSEDKKSEDKKSEDKKKDDKTSEKNKPEKNKSDEQRDQQKQKSDPKDQQSKDQRSKDENSQESPSDKQEKQDEKSGSKDEQKSKSSEQNSKDKSEPQEESGEGASDAKAGKAEKRAMSHAEARRLLRKLGEVLYEKARLRRARMQKPKSGKRDW